MKLKNEHVAACAAGIAEAIDSGQLSEASRRIGGLHTTIAPAMEEKRKTYTEAHATRVQQALEDILGVVLGERNPDRVIRLLDELVITAEGHISAPTAPAANDLEAPGRGHFLSARHDACGLG